MTTKKQKILFLLLGFVISLLSIEISARSLGLLYRVYRLENKKITSEPGKQITKILCLGDSFTYGEGVGYKESYPAQLEQQLNQGAEQKKFIVFNRGIPGNNSSMVLKKLWVDINTYKPEIALLLIGSNDSTTLEDTDYNFFKSHKLSKFLFFSLQLDICLSKLKTYKLFKILALNLRNKFDYAIFEEMISQKKQDELFKKKTEPSDRDLSREKEIQGYLKNAGFLYLNSKFPEAENALKAIPGGVNPQYRKESLLLINLYWQQDKYALATALMQEYLKYHLQDATAIFNFGKNYYLKGSKYPATREESFKQAVDFFNLSLSCVDADNLWLKVENYRYLARLYFDQGENKLAEKMITQGLSLRPKDQFLSQLKKVISNSSLVQKEAEVFRKLLDYNLGQIINLCRTYNIKIFLLNYPYESKGLREEIAYKYKAGFIDIGAQFIAASSGGEKINLLSSDGNHPNAQGYALMAQTILKSLYPEMGVF